MAQGWAELTENKEVRTKHKCTKSFGTHFHPGLVYYIFSQNYMSTKRA
jgi:hypothetical protein